MRFGLDRPGLLRSQLRALLRAASGRDLHVMFPMIAAVDEFDRARALIERELTHLRRHGHALPDTIRIGAMLEVPSLLFSLDEILDFTRFFGGDLANIKRVTDDLAAFTEMATMNTTPMSEFIVRSEPLV